MEVRADARGRRRATRATAMQPAVLLHALLASSLPACILAHQQVDPAEALYLVMHWLRTLPGCAGAVAALDAAAQQNPGLLPMRTDVFGACARAWLHSMGVRARCMQSFHTRGIPGSGMRQLSTRGPNRSTAHAPGHLAHPARANSQPHHPAGHEHPCTLAQLQQRLPHLQPDTLLRLLAAQLRAKQQDGQPGSEVRTGEEGFQLCRTCLGARRSLQPCLLPCP